MGSIAHASTKLNAFLSAGFLLWGILAPCTAPAGPLTDLQATYTGATTGYPDYTAEGTGGYGAGPYSMSFETGAGDDDDLVLERFSASGRTYGIDRMADNLAIRRIDNANVTGERTLLWYEETDRSGTDIDLRPGRVLTMEESLISPVINRGADNVFANDAATNPNNIERIDYFFDGGLTAAETAEQRSRQGFVILDRGGNDAFQIAAILNTHPQHWDKYDHTGLVAAGDGAAGPQWGPTAYSVTSVVFRADNGETDLNPSANVSEQTLSGIFFTFEEMGLTAGQSILGYSLFAADVTPAGGGSSQFNYPTVTTEDSDEGGLDLVAGGVYATVDAAVPEPASCLLFAAGLAGLLLQRRRRTGP